jgi:hypothetical protein
MISDARSTYAIRPSDERGAIRRFVAWALARHLHVILGGLFVLAVGLQQNFDDIHKSQFHPDESRWLNRASYLSALLHPFSSAWENRYLVQGQPPGGSYITALGLLAQGHSLDTNGPWNFSYGSETVTAWNTARGNMPTWDDLMAARRTSAVLGAISALALFLAVTEMTNVAGGLAAGLFFAIHPLSVYLSTLAVSDAAFTWLTAMATLAGMALARKPTWPRAILLGVLLGAGASTKLTPIFLAAGLALIGAGLLAIPLLRRIPLIGRVVDWIPGTSDEQRAPLGWKLVSLPVTTVFYFLMTFPFLWPSPIARTKQLFDFRRAEMNSQASIWPITAVNSRVDALHRTWVMLENRYSSSGKIFQKLAPHVGRQGWDHGIDLPFAVAGLVFLAIIALRRGVVSSTFIGVAVAGGQALLILGGLRVDFDRYYLPIVFVFAMGFGTFTGTLWTATGMLWARLTRRSAEPSRPALSYRPQTAGHQPSAD